MAKRGKRGPYRHYSDEMRRFAHQSYVVSGVKNLTELKQLVEATFGLQLKDNTLGSWKRRMRWDAPADEQPDYIVMPEDVTDALQRVLKRHQGHVEQLEPVRVASAEEAAAAIAEARALEAQPWAEILESIEDKDDRERETSMLQERRSSVSKRLSNAARSAALVRQHVGILRELHPIDRAANNLPIGVVETTSDDDYSALIGRLQAELKAHKANQN